MVTGAGVTRVALRARRGRIAEDTLSHLASLFLPPSLSRTSGTFLTQLPDCRDGGCGGVGGRFTRTPVPTRKVLHRSQAPPQQDNNEIIKDGHLEVTAK